MFLQDLVGVGGDLDVRGDRWNHQRMDWDSHVEQLDHEGRFDREYRMSVPAHGNLVRILDPILERAAYNSRTAEPIQVEHIIGLGLRVLAGGTLSDNRHIFGMSCPASYGCFNDFLDAVNSAPELDINLPSTPEQWHRINREFRKKSTNEILYGVSLATDGFFQRSNCPSQSEIDNIVSYYSGHYESYGLNCQAGVFSDLQFGYFGVVAPGSTNDNIAYPIAKGMKDAIESLPDGLYAVADAAYTVSEKMLIPHTGVERLNADKDAFNYYLSQVRIRVEMAFGRLVNKFRILNGKVEGSMDRVSRILTACARLHNFVIQQDGPFGTPSDSIAEEMESNGICPNPQAPFPDMSYLPVIPNREFSTIPGVSNTRDAIVDLIARNGIRRPLHNIIRQQEQVFVSPLGISVNRDFISPL